MAVRVMGSGYDPTSGWPADDSTGIQWGDTDVPGQFQGGGQGFRWGDADIPGNFGKGGFSPTGRTLIAPTTPPRGVTLTTPGNVPPNTHGDAPPDIMPPESRPIAPNRSVGPFTGGTSTENLFPPPAGRPWWMNLGSPLGLGAAAGGAVLAGIRNENQPGNVPAHGTGPEPVMSPEEIYRRQHPDQAAPAPASVIPQGMPGRAVAPPQTYPHMPWPDTATAPASYPHMPWPDTGATVNFGRRPTIIATPSSASAPAVAKQRPNLGNYQPFVGISRPNADVVNRGGRSSDSGVQGTALDLSRLFGRR
jgi:hypothetical protein